MIWVIELDGSPPCWIRRPWVSQEFAGLGWRFTFQWKEAQKFSSRDEADREMLRLKLSETWSAVSFDEERTQTR